MKNLKDLRINSKFTQQKVADDLGITRAYYSMIENETRKPSLILGLKIAEFFNCSIEEIFKK